MEEQNQQQPEKLKIKLYNKWWLWTIIILLIGGFFYWNDLRPGEIRKKCVSEVVKTALEIEGISTPEGIQAIKLGYEICLHRNGLAE